MFTEEQQKGVLFFLIPVMAMWGILYLCGYRDGSYGAPVNKWILLFGWTTHSFFTWKDKRELLKRFVLALPFALMTVVLLWLSTTFEFSESCGAGVVLFIVLTGGKENLKQFFAVRLVVGAILITLLSIMIILTKSVLTSSVK